MLAFIQACAGHAGSPLLPHAKVLGATALGAAAGWDRDVGGAGGAGAAGGVGAVGVAAAAACTPVRAVGALAALAPAVIRRTAAGVAPEFEAATSGDAITAAGAAAESAGAAAGVGKLALLAEGDGGAGAEVSDVALEQPATKTTASTKPWRYACSVPAWGFDCVGVQRIVSGDSDGPAAGSLLSLRPGNRSRNRRGGAGRCFFVRPHRHAHGIILLRHATAVPPGCLLSVMPKGTGLTAQLRFLGSFGAC